MAGKIVEDSGFDLEIDETRAPCPVVVLRGDLDVAAAPRVRDAALELLRVGHRCLIIDLTALRFIDSTGLSILLLVLKRLRAIEGRLALVCGRGNVLSVLEISRLTSVFDIFATLEEASAAR